MERSKYILALAFIILSIDGYGGSNPTIYQSFTSGNMARWRSAIDSIYRAKPMDNGEILQLVNYKYGYIAWCIDANRKGEARQYLTSAERLVGLLWQRGYNLSMLHAYRSAFIGFEIGLAPLRAPFIGAESMMHAREAVRVNPSNAFGHVQLGNIAFFTPPMFGGSKSQALVHYLTALELMERDGVPSGDWNYLNLMAAIIRTHIELEQYEQARRFCERVLALEPRFEWVKNVLCPEVTKRIKQ